MPICDEERGTLADRYVNFFRRNREVNIKKSFACNKRMLTFAGGGPIKF
jgi:hypothetical protein